MKDYKKLVSYTWTYLKKYKKIVFLFITAVILDQLIDTWSAFLLGTAIDSMLVEGTMQAVITCACLYLGLNVFSFIICYFAAVGGCKAVEVCRAECKRQLADHIERTTLKYSGEVGSMSFMQKMNYDSALLIMFVINTLGQIPGYLCVFLFALFVIFKIDIICGLVALIEIPVIVILYKIFCKRLLKNSEECAECFEIENRKLYELLADTRHVKKNQIFHILEGRYNEAAKEAVKAAVVQKRWQYVYGMINGNMDVFLKVFLFFYGGISVINGKMSVGDFTIVYSYFALITTSCAFFLNFGKDVQDHKAYYERLKAITDVPEETNGTVNLEHIEEIKLSNVKFGYNETETIVQKFSYTFQKDKLYAIVGGNGCGKSTMTSLLLGMYIDEHQGDITYNGHLIKEVDMRTLRRKNIGVCEQEPYLIEDTIRYNMTYSNDKTADETLMNLAYQVSFDGFLKNSELGLDAPVCEGGNALSGGQKQKTALVKVFYKNPDVMVLDEPTSAMDVEGQERLVRYLNEIKKDKIIIVITHDERIMQAADEVVRM